MSAAPVFTPDAHADIIRACLAERRHPCTYPACGGCDFIERRVAFSSPLSTLTHNVFNSTPASSWLAYGETGTVTFLANTQHNWRLATLQAVHELVEAALHRHAGVTRDDIDTADLDALADNTPSRDPAHSLAVSIETQLALALGVPLPILARATHGIHSAPAGAALRGAP